MCVRLIEDNWQNKKKINKNGTFLFVVSFTLLLHFLLGIVISMRFRRLALQALRSPRASLGQFLISGRTRKLRFRE